MKFSQKLAIQYTRAKFKLLSSISKKKAAEKAFALFCTPQRRNRKTPPKIFSEGEKQEFVIDGITIRGWRWKPGTNKPARKVLLLHGFESSVVNFDKYIRALTRKSYEVLAFDAPAHGVSGGKMINAPLYKRTIEAIDKRFGPIQSFMAHSFGGLALALALEETTHDPDYRVVFIAPATETNTAIDTFFRFIRLDPSIRPAFDQLIRKKGGVSPSWYSIRRALRKIHARLLWIHDLDDDTTPISDVYRVRDENFSNVEFVFTKGLGHRRIYRDASVLKKAVDFL
jgi:pimeloyl-ACP methyl ester carboxylesterase